MAFTRQEASQEYNQALKLGLKNQKECIAKGIDPTPPVLDDILNESESAGQVELGVIDIPTDRIIGTKTTGRITAFSRNFLAEAYFLRSSVAAIACSTARSFPSAS